MIDVRDMFYNRPGLIGGLLGAGVTGLISLISNIRKNNFKKKQIDIVSLLNQKIGYYRCELDQLKQQKPDCKRKHFFKKKENDTQLKEIAEKIREKENKIKEIEKQINKIRSCKNKVNLKEYEIITKSDMIVTM